MPKNIANSTFFLKIFEIDEITAISVSSREIGTEKFPGDLGFLNFPFPGKFMSGSREIFLHQQKFQWY